MKRRNSFEAWYLSACMLCLASMGFAQEVPTEAQSLQAPESDASGESYYQTLRRARDGLLNAQDFEAALSPAELFVKALEDAKHPDLARERVVLAYIFAQLNRYDDAEDEYFEAIELMEDELGSFSPELILPMHLLARSYMQARMFPQAVTVLEEAQHISQRNEGLFNVDQSTLIDDLTTAHLGMGDTVTAQNLQIERLQNAQRRFGADDPRVIPFHRELADYYTRSRMKVSAREEYEAILAIEEAGVDPLDPSLLGTLRSIAEFDIVLGERKVNKERIEEILAQNDTIDPVERALSLALLGDWALVGKERREADEYYGQAWNLLATSGEIDPNEFFADPVIISLIPPLTDVDRGLRRLPYAWGTIALEFDVSEDGRVKEITGIGAEPAGLVEKSYADRIEQAVFRPQLVEGKPVDATGVRFTHYFRFYVRENKDEDED